MLLILRGGGGPSTSAAPRRDPDRDLDTPKGKVTMSHKINPWRTALAIIVVLPLVFFLGFVLVNLVILAG